MLKGEIPSGGNSLAKAWRLEKTWTIQELRLGDSFMKAIEEGNPGLGLGAGGREKEREGAFLSFGIWDRWGWHWAC